MRSSFTSIYCEWGRLEMSDGSQHVGSGETPNSSGTVDGCNHESGWIEEETGRLKIIFLPFEKRSGLRRKFTGLQSIGDRKTQRFFVAHLLGIRLRIDGGCDNLNLEVLQCVLPCLEISQLLMTDQSPDTTVNEQNLIFSAPFWRKRLCTAISTMEGHRGEAVSHIKTFSFDCRHSLLTPVQRIRTSTNYAERGIMLHILRTQYSARE